MFSRDFLMHAYAGDCMQEYGKVVILGRSVEKHPVECKEESVPWKACGWLHKRMHVQDMEAVVEALSPNTAQVRHCFSFSFLIMSVRETFLFLCSPYYGQMMIICTS